MAFNMNKPVIKGTTKHSALLAKAEEATRTHGVDPILGAAAIKRRRRRWRKNQLLTITKK